ncbi:unnamed protein product [Gongylonema pulchrum]|uniref:Secreted protein n=1 Tax=Gongylonema pulchrum TaxID=637853 RepID=A0A183E989_9BILA|nr:unnamed protein product [Gongylonema pulchrum]
MEVIVIFRMFFIYCALSTQRVIAVTISSISSSGSNNNDSISGWNLTDVPYTIRYFEQPFYNNGDNSSKNNGDDNRREFIRIQLDDEIDDINNNSTRSSILKYGEEHNRSKKGQFKPSGPLFMYDDGYTNNTLKSISENKEEKNFIRTHSNTLFGSNNKIGISFLKIDSKNDNNNSSKMPIEWIDTRLLFDDRNKSTTVR